MSTDIHTLAEQARHMGYTGVEAIINRLERMIARNEAYLTRRALRGTHTPTDDAIAEDCAVCSLVIEMLEQGEASEPNWKTCSCATCTYVRSVLEQ